MGATVTIRPVNQPDALFCKYPGQFNAQDAILYLDTRDGELYCDYNAAIGGGTTMAEFHRLVLSTVIPPLTAEVANALMADVASLAQTVLDGADEDWDGDNNVGTLTEEAQAAWSEIVARCAEENFDSSEQVCAWEVEDWFIDGDEVTRVALEIDAATTDEQISAIAAQQVEMATTVSSDAGYGVLDRGDVEQYLTRLRDEARTD